MTKIVFTFYTIPPKNISGPSKESFRCVLQIKVANLQEIREKTATDVSLRVSTIKSLMHTIVSVKRFVNALFVKIFSIGKVWIVIIHFYVVIFHVNAARRLLSM